MPTFFIPYLPAGLNGPKGLIRAHWRARSKERDTVAAHVFCATRCIEKVKPPVRLIFDRHYCGKHMDPDNCAASAKHVLDAIVKEGILPDDSPDVIGEFTVKQTRVASRKLIGVRITIEELR